MTIMKKNMFIPLRLLLVILIGLLIQSCAKDGATGPAGVQGPAGIQGPVGLEGAAGSVILSGNGVPAATLGKEGDFYLDKTTSNLYGPKTAAGWGTPISMKGTTGATGAVGAAGSAILSGTIAPTNAIGKVGDYYLNKANYDFYGPKTAAGWGSPVNLRGPQGNANVVSGTFTLVDADYQLGTWAISTGSSSVTGLSAKVALKNIPAITAGIFNTGTVLVYLKTPSNLSATPTVWTPLPYDIRTFTTGYLISIKFNYETGKLRIYYMFVKTDAAAANISVSNETVPAYEYKYVIIAGNAGERASSLGIDLNNYSEVAKYFNLPE